MQWILKLGHGLAFSWQDVRGPADSEFVSGFDTRNKQCTLQPTDTWTHIQISGSATKSNTATPAH